MVSHCRPGSREDQNHGFAESISALHVVEIDPEADPRWEALVTMLPNGLVYHHPAWLLAFLLQAVVERVREEPRACLQLKLFSNPLDGLVEGVVGIPWSTTYRLELPEQPEHLRFGNSRNHSRIRWAINKATRLGVVVRRASGLVRALPAYNAHQGARIVPQLVTTPDEARQAVEELTRFGGGSSLSRVPLRQTGVPQSVLCQRRDLRSLRFLGEAHHPAAGWDLHAAPGHCLSTRHRTASRAVGARNRLGRLLASGVPARRGGETLPDGDQSAPQYVDRPCGECGGGFSLFALSMGEWRAA